MNCSGSIEKDEKTEKSIMSLQGDHRALIKEILIKEKIVMESNIIVHGF